MPDSQYSLFRLVRSSLLGFGKFLPAFQFQYVEALMPPIRFLGANLSSVVVQLLNAWNLKKKKQ